MVHVNIYLAGKEELENMMLKYNEEIKVLREKVRES